jgi:hypothetical protein
MTLWLKARLVRLALSILVGSAMGGMVFWASQLKGVSLFVLAGAVAGAGAGLFAGGLGQISLRDVTVSVPQFSELHFVVTTESATAAWRLFVEISTRVATQPLREDAGRAREALTSLYVLFEAVRTTLKESRPSRPKPGGPTVEQLAIGMVNLELRPFLSYWHVRLGDWEEISPDRPDSEWPDNQAFRVELAKLQEDLREYCAGFARLAGVGEPERILGLGDLRN